VRGGGRTGVLCVAEAVSDDLVGCFDWQ
jgi:hypothetical protein